MQGKSHIIGGIAMGSIGYSMLRLSQKLGYEGLDRFVSLLSHTMLSSPQNFGKCVGLYVLGSLLPDIDSKESLIGRFNPIPMPHRWIPHSLWFMVPFVCMAVKLSPVFWFLVFGMFTHLLLDSMSKAGVCFLNPFTGYVRYPSGAFVKKGHVISLYANGEIGEKLLLLLVCLIAVTLAMINIFM